ncbi:MAG: alpha/beta hydrolase [Myxococcales bacterium FL481]|nr:MAG: alpha/beta hydrolase [Myxococcales bacterium FL481]
MSTPNLPAKRVRLLLLPGMDGTGVLFRPFVDALPSWISPEVITYPNAGKNRYRDLEPIVRDAVRASSECAVLGWSFSGPLALRVAISEPDRVKRVILAASFVRPPIPALVPLRPLFRSPTVGLLRTIRRLPVWFGRRPSDPYRRAKAEIWRLVPARTLAKRAREALRVDARNHAEAYPGPLHYLASATDRVIPPHNLEEILRLRPDTTVTRLSGGHFSLYTHPQDAANIVATILEPMRSLRPDRDVAPARQPDRGAPPSTDASLNSRKPAIAT